MLVPQTMLRRMLPFALALALAAAYFSPASAFLFQTEAEDPNATVAAFGKNGLLTDVFSFSESDFRVLADGKATLTGIQMTALPPVEAGVLQVGNELIAPGDTILTAALDGLRFYPTALGETSACFSFLPIFSTGAASEPVNVNLYLLSEANSGPIAENLTLNTYKNVAISGQFAAVDPEGDLLSFQLVDKPARGAVTISEDGSGTFLYTPYENKTGKDSFTYIAIDAVGNQSEPATVSVRIDKAQTKVTYADLEGHPAHKAAIRLAEEGVFVGASMNGQSFFQPDTPVSRSEFLAMAMQATGVDALSNVTSTGFADDSAIAAWAKGYVASALQSGLIQGSRNMEGQVVFAPNDVITAAEASVLLDRMLNVTSVSVETFGYDTSLAPEWATQAAVNLTSCGVLPASASLTETLNRGSAAELLCSALELLDSRKPAGFFSFFS